MLLQPRFLPFECFLLVGGWVGLQLANVVTELVIGHDESTLIPCVRDAVRVIVVLGWCRYHNTQRFELVQSCDGVWNFLGFYLLDAHLHQLLLFANFSVVEQVIRQETNDFVSVLLPVANSDLNASAAELSIGAVPHRNILSIKYDQRLNFKL